MSQKFSLVITASIGKKIKVPRRQKLVFRFPLDMSNIYPGYDMAARCAPAVSVTASTESDSSGHLQIQRIPGIKQWHPCHTRHINPQPDTPSLYSYLEEVKQ